RVFSAPAPPALLAELSGDSTQTSSAIDRRRFRVRKKLQCRVQIRRARSSAQSQLLSRENFFHAGSHPTRDFATRALSRQTDFPEFRGMARSVTRARALPAPHPPPGSSGRSRKSESASPPFCPPHDGKDAQPIETRLLVFAWQLQRCCVAIRSIFAKAIS